MAEQTAMGVTPTRQQTTSFESRPTATLSSVFAPTASVASQAIPTDVSSLLSFIVGFTALHDWLKLVVIGGTLEFIRRTFSLAWSSIVASFFITVHFEGDDDAYDWMMVWLSRQPSWRKAREIQVSTRNWGVGGRYMGQDENVVILPDADATADGSPPPPESSRKLSFLPAFGITHNLFYKGHWLQVSRDRKYIGEGSTVESLTVSISGHSHAILHALLRDAQNLHKSEEANRVGVYIADPYNNWRWSGSRPKRPLKSIILDPAIKETLIEDAQDFLSSEAWYAERGIPFRRGYLLHGAPGSGKTSLIHAVAGALDLDIYVISLSKRGLDDATLNELICALPARSIALMEDIDAAFTHGVNRDGLGVDADDDDEGRQGSGGALSAATQDTGRGVTLSGLLGAIDGVAAQEGRLLFATTNKYHVLDAALIRPGRLDLHIEFHLATAWQAGEIFKCFYPASPAADEQEAITNGPHAASPIRTVTEKEGDGTESTAADLLKPAVAATSPPSYTSTPSQNGPRCLDDPDPPAQQEQSNGSVSPHPHETSPSLHSMARKRQAPKLSTRQLNNLAERFMSFIPDGELSMASIQGHLMTFKTRPEDAVQAAKEFVERERERRRTREKERDREIEREAKKKAALKEKERLVTKEDEEKATKLGLPTVATAI